MPRTRSRLLLATLLCAFAALPASAAAAPDLFLDDPNPTGAAFNDGILAPGETFNLTPSFTVGSTYFDGGNGTISAPLASKVDTSGGYLQAIPAASPSTATYPANPFVVSLAPDYECGVPTPVTLAIDGPNGHGEFPLHVPTGAAGPHQSFVSDDIGDSIADSETVESDVQVTPGKVKSLRVHVGALSHTYSLRWYEIVLVSPKGTRVKLFNRVGEDSQKVITDLTFSDAAGMDYTDGSITQYDNLTVRPANPLSAFDGEDAAGTWRLEVRDVHEAGSPRSSRAKARAGAGEVVGQLDAWSLDVAGAVCARTPVAAISPSPLVLSPAGGTVINGSESVDPGKNNAGSANGAITKYEWDLDGSGGFEVNGGASPTTTFPAAPKGRRTIKLQVTDNDGLLNTATVDALITERPNISAVAATPSSPEAGQLATVTATATDPDGSIASYAWDFDGDGIFEVSGSTSENTAHAWDKSGPQVVRVKVTDDIGATRVKAFTVTVANKPPVARISINTTPAIMGQAVVFDASASTDPDGEVVGYRWDLDGVPGYEETTGAVPTLNYTFNESGPHTVTVEVRDNSDIPDTETLQVLVTAAPNAVIQASTTSPQPSQVVSFDGGASTDGEPGGSITKYEWDLDGNNSYETTGKTATKSYPNVTNVQVKLRVTNVAGAKGEAFLPVSVKAAPAPVPTPAPTPTPKPTPTVGPNGGVVPVPGPDIVPTTKGLDPTLERTDELIVDTVDDAVNGTGDVADTAVGTSGFQAKLSVASKWKVKKALKGGIVVKVTANAPGKLVIKGMLAAKLAKSLGLKPKGNAPLAVASGKVAITKAGTYKFIVKVPKKYQRYVKKSKKSPLTLRAGVTQTATGEILAIGKVITLVK